MLKDVLGTEEEELEDEGFEDTSLDPTVELLDPSSGPSPATAQPSFQLPPLSRPLLDLQGLHLLHLSNDW